MDEYSQNPDFKAYVDAYCKQSGITPEAAVQHALVRHVEAEYRDMRINRFDIIASKAKYSYRQESKVQGFPSNGRAASRGEKRSPT